MFAHDKRALAETSNMSYEVNLADCAILKQNQPRNAYQNDGIPET